MKVDIFLACLALGLWLIGGPAADAQDMSMMTYNIWWGGQDRYPVFDRNDAWMDVIISRNPDIVLLQECNGWLPEEEGYITTYTDMLNEAFPDQPPHVGYVGEASSTFHLAFLTRYPVLSWNVYNWVDLAEERIYIGHCFIHAALMVDNRRVHILGVHFYPGEHREEREREARALLYLLDHLPANEAVWVLGDFNCYSPVDIAEGSVTPPDWDCSMSALVVGAEPVEYLLEEGYHDEIRDRYPTELEYTHGTEDFFPSGDGPCKRIDYIFSCPESEWGRLFVETADDSLGDVGSDHYAIFGVYTRDLAAAENHAPAAELTLRAYPNPVVNGQWVEYELPEEAQALLAIFSTDGRRVRTLASATQPAGVHRIYWDGCDHSGVRLPRGAYFVRLSSDRFGIHATRLLRTAP